VQCAESLRVQAYFDGELDALSAADIERHSGACAECRELLDELHRVRAAVRRDLPYDSAPSALRSRIRRSLDQENGFESPALDESPAFHEGLGLDESSPPHEGFGPRCEFAAP